MSTRTSAVTLSEAVKQLTRDWEQTRISWRDAKAEEFERTYLDELPGHVARSLTVMEEIDAVLRKARNACE